MKATNSMSASEMNDADLSASFGNPTGENVSEGFSGSNLRKATLRRLASKDRPGNEAPDRKGEAKSTGSATPVTNDVELLVINKDRMLAGVQLAEEQTHRDLADNLQNLIHGIRVERAACSSADDQIAVTLQQLREKSKNQVLQIRHKWYSREAELERIGDEKVSDLKGLIVEDKVMHQTAAQYTQHISDEICHLYSDIEQERKYRAEKGEKLVEGVRYKLDEIKDAIRAEQRVRLESQNTLLELFGQMGQKMQQELDKSRKDRDMSTHRLIELMEHVLPKLDRARQFGASVAQEDLEGKDGIQSAGDMAASVAMNAQRRRSSISDGRKTLGFAP